MFGGFFEILSDFISGATSNTVSDLVTVIIDRPGETITVEVDDGSTSSVDPWIW